MERASAGESVPDPLPRTVLSWQRTLLAAAGTSLLIVLAVAGGHPGWAIMALLLAGLLAPVAVRRERQLLRVEPPRVSMAAAATVSGVVVALAFIAAFA